jgi:hypothetical protein
MSLMALHGGGRAGRDDEVPAPDPGFFRGCLFGAAIVLPLWVFGMWWLWG